MPSSPPVALPNPLLELHQQTEAEFQSYGEVEIVSTFGEPQAEYAAIHKGCALVDLPQRGILQVDGKDRLDFLNRFLTNELVGKDTHLPMAAGKGVYAFLLNNKGRIAADMNVLERGECTYLETDARNIPPLQFALEKYVFSEQVRFTNKIGTLHQIALHGRKSLEILRRLVGELAELPPMSSTSANIEQTDLTIWRDDPTGAAGDFLILPIAAARSVWDKTILQFASAKADAEQASKREVWPTGWAAFNTARIEAGRPMFGIDFDDSVLPAETGQLDRAVSFTKGCYLGQEIVARMHARQQWTRQIIGIKMEEDALPMAGTPIFDANQQQIGGITSSTISPILSNSALCLGMMKKQFAVAGTAVFVPAEGSIRKAMVSELPFIKHGGE